MYCGRFAPSPTGALHAGSLVAALGSWLCARHAGGRWLVRMDDIDPPRAVIGAADAILAALPAFGMVADGPVLFQSQRTGAYVAALDRLKAQERVFPCWCSRSDLAASGGIHRDGRCVSAPDASRPPAWRLRMPDITIDFDDALQGPVRENVRDSAGDIVVYRADGLPAYHLACVVDDADHGITEVVRGCDLLHATARQIALQQCLDLPTPGYLHLPLACGADGRKLSKSTDAHPVDPADPLPALSSALTFLGLDPAPHARTPQALLHAALERFTPARLARCSERRVP